MCIFSNESFYKHFFITAASAEERIIGGSDASTPVPFQVSLQSGGSHFCGASLLSTTHVMSAGHCRISGWQLLVDTVISVTKFSVLNAFLVCKVCQFTMILVV